MKAILILFISFISAFSQTWTIHNWKDNYMGVGVYSDNVILDCGWGGVARFSFAMWDWSWDVAHPGQEDSYYQEVALQCDGHYDGPQINGFQEAYTIIFPGAGVLGGSVVSGDGTQIGRTVCDIGAGWPSYAGDTFFDLPFPGEWWIDFTSNGTVRISTTQPADFGKWAWDGSINPSWVAAKKGFAKGHNKQPLPTTK